MFVTLAAASGRSGNNTQILLDEYFADLTAQLANFGVSAESDLYLDGDFTNTLSAITSSSSAIIESTGEYVRIETPTVLELATLQGQAISWTPTLLVGDGTGAWTADTLPAGASIDSGTGQVTGTLNTLGKTDVLITYTEGSLVDRIPVSFHVYDQVDTTTFPGGNIPSNVAIPASNRLYRFGGDSDADTTIASTLGRTGVLIDLNGYTVTYDNTTNDFTVANNDFVSGTDDWDVSGVTGFTNTNTATLVSRRAPTEGANALHSTVAGNDTESMETVASFTMVANRWYALTLWWTNTADGDFFNLTITIGSNVSSSLGAGEGFSEGGGFRAGTKLTWIFKADANESVPINIQWANTNASAREINIALVNLDRAYIHGISSDPSAGGEWPYSTGSGGTSKVSIVNGTIEQTNYSVWSPCIVGDQSLTVDSITVRHHQRSMTNRSAAISFLLRGTIINNCHIYEDSLWVSNRDQKFGYALNTSTSISESGIGAHYRDNVIYSSPQGGIRPSSSSGQTYGTICKWNTIVLQSRYTNGFGIDVLGISGNEAEIAHNTIDLTQGATDAGRGISVGSHVRLHHNYVKVRSLPQYQEYSIGALGHILGGAYAMQMEILAGSISNTEFDNETYITEGSGGGAAFRVNSPVSTGIVATNCVFQADSSTSSPVQVFSALYFSEPASSTIDLAEIDLIDCEIITNRWLFRFTTDAGAFTNSLTIVNPLLTINDGGIYVGGSPWSVASPGAVVIDTPTYFDSFTQTEVETKDASDAQVSIV